jgi:hypothetical protein
VTHLSLPPDGKAWPIKHGTSGMETLVLLARESPLDMDLKAHLPELPRPTLQDVRSLVWFDDWALVRGGKFGESSMQSGDRGPSFFDVDLADPVLQIQELLKDHLKDHFSMMRAVSFANRGG